MRSKKGQGLNIVLAGVVVLSISFACFAGDFVELEPIVVTPSRFAESYEESGRSVSIITTEDIKFQHPNDVSDVLKGAASITINNYGAVGANKTINMRGATAQQVLVMVDGRPINNPRSGDIDLSTVAVEDIERIEVLRGPASSMYGSSAMGGVVNIITKNPPKHGQETKLISSFGTFRTYQERLSHRAGFENLGYTINAGYNNSEGQRDNSKYQAKDINSKIIYEFGTDNRINLNAGFFEDNLGLPGLVTYPDTDDEQIDRKNFLDLIWDAKPWNDQIEISSRVYQNYDRLEFIETPTPLDKATHTTKTKGINLKYNQQIFSGYRAICGFDYISNLNDSTVTEKHNYTVRAAYLENQLNFRDKLKLNFGVRVDDYSNFGSEVSPSFNLLYKLDDSTKAHFLISRSFRAPTFNDLYWPLSSFAEGNANLKPEKGITGEIGIERIFSEICRAELTYFSSEHDDLINWQQDTDGLFRPNNIDAAEINGIEQRWNVQLFDELHIDFNYTYLRAKDKKIGKHIIYQPKHKAGTSLKYTGLFGMNMGLKWQFQDRRFHNASNTVYIKRHHVFTLNMDKNIKDNINIFFNLDNLLNRKYQSVRDYPLPGFALTGGMKIEF
ncbi:MAG: TonB-dependent receptor [Candidatus Omnitrophota bacterium]